MRRRITIAIIIIILLLIFFACVFIPRDNIDIIPTASETLTNTPTATAQVQEEAQVVEETDEAPVILTNTPTATYTATIIPTDAPEIYDPANYSSEELWRIIAETIVEGFICPELSGCDAPVNFGQGELIRVVNNEEGILTLVTLENEIVYINEDDAELVSSFDEPDVNLEDEALTQRAAAAQGATETAIVRQGFATQTAEVRGVVLTETAAARQLQATQTTVARQGQGTGTNTTGGGTSGNGTGSTTGGGTTGNGTGNGTGSTTGGGNTTGITVIYLPGGQPPANNPPVNPTAVPSITPDPNYTPEAYGDYPPGMNIRPTPTSPGPDGGYPAGVPIDPGLGVPPPWSGIPPY